MRCSGPKRFNVFPKELDLAVGAFEQAGDHREERRFSAAARPNQKGRLTEANVQIDSSQGENAGLTQAKLFFQMVTVDGSIHGSINGKQPLAPRPARAGC
jgi:hypothetical protein